VKKKLPSSSISSIRCWSVVLLKAFRYIYRMLATGRWLQHQSKFLQRHILWARTANPRMDLYWAQNSP